MWKPDPNVLQDAMAFVLQGPTPMLKTDQSSRRYFALALWLIVGWFFFSLAWQWIVSSSSDQQLTEYVTNVVRRSTLERRAPRDVRLLIAAKAEILSISIPDDGLSVTGERGNLRTVIAYNTELKLPLLDHVFYRIQFRHNVNSSDIR
jgi:hypothetical protein